MTSIVANGSSLKIYSPSDKQKEDKMNLTKYSKGLYVSLEGKPNYTS